MIRAKQLRRHLDGRIVDAEKKYGSGERAARAGRILFVKELREQIGLLTRDAGGNLVESIDEKGNRKLAEGCFSPHEFSLREMARAIGGEEFLESFDPEGGGPDALDLLETGAGFVDPTHFININTFTAATAGLVDAQVMEKFKNVTFIGDQLFETRPTRLNGQKMIGTTGISGSTMDLERKPGEPHPRTVIGERWINTPELTEKALAIEITQEAVFYDLTGQVLDTAAGVGERLGYEKEKTQLRLFAGITNSYNYKGTAYDTYQASTPWINDVSNPLVDFADIDEALEFFTSMTDPETGREIELMDVPTIVHDPVKETLWDQVLMATEIRQTTNTNFVSIAPAPSSTKRNYKRLSSVILRNLIDVEGGVTLAQAKDWWFMGNPKRAFKWMEAWPLRVRQASANEYVMLDRGMIAAYFANYRGVGAVVEPRYVLRNKN